MIRKRELEIQLFLPQFLSISHLTNAIPVDHDLPVGSPPFFVTFYNSIIFESTQILIDIGDEVCAIRKFWLKAYQR